MHIKGKVVVITGGASGLGAAAAQLFAQEGALVNIFDFNETLGVETAQKLNAKFYKVDVTNEQSVLEAVNAVIKQYQSIHILINCAGILIGEMIATDKSVHKIESFERIFKVNVLGTFIISRIVAKQMISQSEVDGQRGVILNVSSVAGMEGQRGQTAYGGSKGAIIGMTLPMARDLGRYNIRVVTIAPGIFQTPMAHNISQKINKVLEKETALNRLGDPKEFAMACKGAVECSFMNGCVVRIDGGTRLSHI